MIVLSKLFILLLVAGCWASPDDISQENGGFRGILVAIGENVPYDDNILTNLKNVLVQASEALYHATEYDIDISGNPELGLTSGKHFAQITVLLPKSWPIQAQCEDARSETYDKADFRVRTPTAQYVDFLYTRMPSSDCGKSGDYTEIPYPFLKDLAAQREIYGEDLGKVILHEWAQLRWGLREESNNKDGGATCYMDNIDWKGIHCSSTVTGQITLDPPESNEKCKFTPGNDDANQATASIMYFNMPFYKKMYTFCDSQYDNHTQVDKEVLHDGSIDNPHNRLCNGKSAWQVLRNHPDFLPSKAGSKVSDFENSLDLQCVQKKSVVRMVLVMDISSSMAGKRIEMMGSNVAEFLESMALSVAEIGMVEFESEALAIAPMTPLDSDATKQFLKNKIPTETRGGTNIGLGIMMALQVLEEGGKLADGGVIITFTDGADGGSLDDVKTSVLAKKAKVDGVLLAEVADDHNLRELIRETKGHVCIYEDNGGNDNYDCLMEILKKIDECTPEEIKTEDVQVPASGSVDGSVPIDASFQDNLRLTLSWTSTTFSQRSTNCMNVVMVVTAPDGTVIDENDPRYDFQPQFRLIIVDGSGFPEGEWKYKVQSGSFVCNARLRIEGFTDTSSPDVEKQPILMTARANKVKVEVQAGGNLQDNIVTLYVTLLQDVSPVVDADVSATVQGGGKSQPITLLDNGQGADYAADDGIYSAYFYQYSGDGMYSMRAAAKGISGQTHILREERQLHKKTDSDGYEVVLTQTLVPVAAFERSAIGESFEVETNGVSDINQFIPPARINDLKRSAMTNDSAVLTWTAVGASMNDGTADHYEVRICANVTDEWDTCMEVEQSMLTEGDLSTPKSSGRPELIAISLDYLEIRVGSPYFVRVKAVDQYGNKGDSSNLAQIKVAPAAPPATNPPPTNPPPTQTPTPGTPGPGTPGPVPPPPKNINVAAIAGAVACAAVIAMVTVGGAITRVNMKKKRVHPANPEQPVESVQLEDREMTI